MEVLYGTTLLRFLCIEIKKKETLHVRDFWYSFGIYFPNRESLDIVEYHRESSGIVEYHFIILCHMTDLHLDVIYIECAYIEIFHIERPFHNTRKSFIYFPFFILTTVLNNSTRK